MIQEPSNDPAHDAFVEETAACGAGVLSRALGRSVRLGVTRSFRGPRARATVLRCRVEGGVVGTPNTVIVKRFRADGGGPYDPGDPDVTGPRARFLNEWSGASLLQGLVDPTPLGPVVYGGDGRLGVLVIEDLGEGACLADLLQGNDAEAAEAALAAYAVTVGRLHALTIGREPAHRAMRDGHARGGALPPSLDPIAEWHREALAKFRQACASVDLAISSACERELESVAATIGTPGPFLAYSVADTCPDNHRYVSSDGQRNGYLRFFDMEFGGFRHALLDAAYVWMPFPTCWCVARLPASLPAQLESAYRTALVQGCPEAAGDAEFGKALVAACVVWLVLTVAWDFERVLERDDDWGIATVRQRLPLRAGNVAIVAEHHRCVPALADLAGAFADRLLDRWGSAATMPLYVAFRS